jgi:serine/threonine-protein kinase
VNEAAPRLRDLVADVPLALEAIIAKCLTKNADMRYNNAEQLRDDLRRFMNGEPTLAVDEARVRSGKAPLGSATLDQATTIMAPVQGDSSSTQILPRTSVMPATMAPVETLPDYDDDRPSKRSYVVGAAVAGIVILGGIVFLISTLGGSSGVAVPNVKGVTCDVAKLKLEEAKFIVAFNPPETVCDATNIVSGQVPASGDLAKTGEAITLVFPVAQADVPALLGLTAEAAQAAVEGAGFVFVKGPDVIDKTYAIGQVAVQTPGGMTKLAKGQTVTVNVSGGTGQLAVPNVVIGQTTESAQTFLIAEPYKFVVTVTPEPSATVAKGIVIRTDPVQGTLVDAASPITIFVSSGPAPVAMPNVKGQTEATAVAALGKLGITATVEYVDLAAGNANVGKVIAQDTAAASMVNPGTAVVITVGRDSSVPVAPAG